MDAWDIEFHDLTVGYGRMAVLRDINATLPAGKVSVILGGSGCGKSTLLRHIIGLSRPIAGEILIGGHDLFRLDSRAFRRVRRHMGVLFQDGALLGALSLAQNVALPLSEHLRRDSVGPEAVGNATTSAVVISCVLILAADYVLTSFLL